MGVSDFLFTAIVVAVVDAEVEDTVVVGVEVGLVAVMGFMVADTGFTARISALSGVLSFDLNTKEEHLLLVFFFWQQTSIILQSFFRLMVTLVNQFTSPDYLAPRPFPLGPGQTQVTFQRNLLEHCWIVF